jgi:hypothetical protein
MLCVLPRGDTLFSHPLWLWHEQGTDGADRYENGETKEEDRDMPQQHRVERSPALVFAGAECME